MADASIATSDGRAEVLGGSSRVVRVTTPLDILQAQEAVLTIGGALGLRPHDVHMAVAVVSRMASALLTYSGEAVVRLAPARGVSGLEVEGHGGVIPCDSDRRKIEASIVRLLGTDEWTVPADVGPRVSARKTFFRKERPQA